jgi:hypothetical protein
MFNVIAILPIIITIDAFILFHYRISLNHFDLGNVAFLSLSLFFLFIIQCKLQIIVIKIMRNAFLYHKKYFISLIQFFFHNLLSKEKKLKIMIQ